MMQFQDFENMPHSPLLALERAAKEYPESYFESGDRGITFSELERESNRFANHLARLGVEPGDRVAALMRNSVDNLIAWFGTSKRGAIWAPTNTAHTGEWLAHQITDCDPKVVVIEHDLLPAYEKIDLPFSVIVRGGASDSFSAYASASDEASTWRPNPGDLSHLIYTSGTTGRAKGCMASHNYMVNFARLYLIGNPRYPSDVLWTSSPLFHISASGYVIATLLSGGSMHIAESFSLSNFWPNVEAAGATAVQLMGIAANLIAKAPDTEASVRYKGKLRMLTGAQRWDTQQLIKERFGVERAHVTAFGQSEGGMIAMLGEAPYREGTCGLATDSFDFRIVDENDCEVSHGVVGQIVYRPLRPNVMCSGYWRNPEATAKKVSNLWWHSGDYGYQDEDGYLYFKDRGDDRLRRSGENVSSFELETAFSKHEQVAVVAAYGIPAQLGEDDIVISVMLREGSTLTPAELHAWAKDRVPRFAMPRYFHFRSELPRNPIGKIMKYALRAQGVPADAWDSSTAEPKRKKS